MLTGSYKDIIYSIEYREHHSLGAYYDIRLVIGEKISRAREFTLVRAIDTLIAQLKAWAIEDEATVMRPEDAQELISEWDEFSARIDHDSHLTDQYSRRLIAGILSIVLILKDAGFIVTDDWQWYHPSEAN